MQKAIVFAGFVAEDKMFDTIIIGGGPAALSASLYAARQKLNFVTIAKELGGQLAWSAEVENYLGFESILGAELVSRFQKQVEKNKTVIKQEEVKNIRRKDKNFVVETNKSSYQTRTVLIASGKTPRELNISGEEKFFKKGIYYCAVCDAPLFKGKEVAVIGGGNSALDAALLLGRYATRVYIINITSKLTGEKVMLDKVIKNKKIETINNAVTKEFFGTNFLEQIRIRVNDKEELINVQGAFIEIGYVPAVGFDKLTRKNEWNEIVIHKKGFIENLTSVPGIFAAGDVTNVSEKQVAVAVGEGVKAILSITKYLAK